VLADKTLMTSAPGLFVAGDVREGSTKQAASAAGEGVTAALMIREYLKQVPDKEITTHRTVNLLSSFVF
jgi:thioredoxin reductase (NADPH)